MHDNGQDWEDDGTSEADPRPGRSHDRAITIVIVCAAAAAIFFRTEFVSLLKYVGYGSTFLH